MSDTGPGPGSFLSRFFQPELRAWRGQQRLGVVFWGYGILGNAGLILLHVVALKQGELVLEQALIIISALYAAWVLPAIWRCSDNTMSFWGVVAKWLTIAWAFNSAFVLLSLQLELLIRYDGG